MNQFVTKETRTCISCGQEYEAHVGHVMGMALHLDRGYCVKCRQQMVDEEEKREIQAEEKRIADKREEWRKSCGIPRRFLDARFNKFDRKVDASIIRAWRQCEEFTSKFSCRNPQISKSMFLFSMGVWGVGKTYLASCVAHGVLDKWNDDTWYCPVLFTSEPQLFLRIRSTFNHSYDDKGKSTEKEDDIYRQLTTVPLLIIDDIGKEEVTDSRFVQRAMFAIIDGRYQNMLPVIITANMSPDDLEQHLGGDRGNCASMNRLVEMTGAAFYELRGKSYREQMFEKKQ